MGRPTPQKADEVLDHSYLRVALDAAVRDRLGTSAPIDDITIEPHKRSLIRYTLHLDGGASQTSGWRIIGKVYPTVEAGQYSFDAMRRLWDHGFSHQAPAQVRIPEPYGYLSSLRLLLMEEAPGRRLKSLLLKGRARPEHMSLLAVALAKMHSFPLRLGEPFTLDDHLAIRCNSLPDALARAFPQLGSTIRWIVETARALEAREGHEVFTLAHGDLHLGQVHLQDDVAWLLDLDRLHHGDPAYDVAMVLVALKQLEQKTRQSAYIRPLRDAFVSTYFSLMDWRVARRLPLQEALIHLKRACKRFRWQDEEGWAETIRLQIRQSVTCLEAMEHIEAPRRLQDVVDLYDRCPATV